MKRLTPETGVVFESPPSSNGALLEGVLTLSALVSPWGQALAIDISRPAFSPTLPDGSIEHFHDEALLGSW